MQGVEKEGGRRGEGRPLSWCSFPLNLYKRQQHTKLGLFRLRPHGNPQPAHCPRPIHRRRRRYLRLQKLFQELFIASIFNFTLCSGFAQHMLLPVSPNRTVVMEVKGAGHAVFQAQPRPDQNHLDPPRDRVLGEVLEYAYEHNLIRDHRLNSFSLSHLFGKLFQSTMPATTNDGVTNCSHLTYLELPNPTPRAEKLRITESAAKLLCEVRRELSDKKVMTLAQEFCNDNKTNISVLKLEMPILRTDNDRDVRDFQREISARQDIHKRDHRIPFDPVNVAAGEGLELPAEAQLEADAFLKGLEGEKLGVTRESTKYLVDNLGTVFTEEDRTSLILEELRDIKYEKVSVGLRIIFPTPSECSLKSLELSIGEVGTPNQPKAKTISFHSSIRCVSHTNPLRPKLLNIQRRPQGRRGTIV